MIYKLDCILSSPYDYSLYLDSDTYIMDYIEDIFLLLEKFDLVICHGHNRYRRYELINQAKDSFNNPLFTERIPYCFAPLQGGLIAYNSSRTREFFESVRKMYLEKAYYDDQAIIRELLWNTKLRFYILPPEYNFSSIDYIITQKKNNYRTSIPKIFHNTQAKNKSIVKLVSRVYNLDNINLYKKKAFHIKRRQRLRLLIRKIINVITK